MTRTRHRGLDLITGSAQLPSDYVVTEQQMKAASRTLSRQTTLSTGDEDSLRSAAGVVVTRPKKRRGMNKTETAYSERLQRRVQSGEIIWFGFECIRLRLADGAWFKPDFTVIPAQGPIEFHEVKGFWREAARVRIKVAAERYQWAKFVAVQKEKARDGGGWKREEF